jgi:hypothetical protein
MITFKKWNLSWTPPFVISVIIVSRLWAFLIFENLNIYNDSGVSIKLAGPPAYLDYAIYKNHISAAWSEITRPLNFFVFLIEDWRGAINWLKSQSLKPGPLFPMMLGFSGYEESMYLLSFLYQLAGAVLGWHWAKQLRDRGEALWLQVLSACFPALIYYAFLVSTDLLYACLVAVWLISARAVLEGKAWSYGWTVSATILLMLARPNSLSLIPLMSLLAWKGKSFRAWLSWSVFWAAVGVYMLIYYLPYYWVHDSNATATHYWGILPSEYYKGLWAGIPAWISQPISWVLLAASKLLHAVGLRPSYASVDTWLAIARALPGVLFLPGLVYLFFAAQWFERSFVFFFMVPIFVGASQERYLLALTPILLLWGVRAWRKIGRWGYSQVQHLKS